MKTFVIADDFSGAAEIAGIAARDGPRVLLTRDVVAETNAEVVVLDSDTRGLPGEIAAARVALLLRGVDPGTRVYKKIDSLLRGPVVAEIDSAMSVLGRRKAILVPANPSRGRTIENGIYRVDGRPLHELPLAADPSHPIRTSNVRELLSADDTRIEIRSRPTVDASDGVILGEAATTAEVDGWARATNRDTLAIGAADFFSAWLPAVPFSPATLPTGEAIVHISGTATRTGGQALRLAMNDDASAWKRSALETLAANGRVTLAIDRPIEGDRSAAERYGQRLNKVAQKVIAAANPDRILVDGGATAARLLDTLGWRTFDVEAELAVGVVALRPLGVDTVIVVKPGSYAWPDSAWR